MSGPLARKFNSCMRGSYRLPTAGVLCMQHSKDRLCIEPAGAAACTRVKYLAVVKEQVVRHAEGAVRRDGHQADADGGEQDCAHTVAREWSSRVEQLTGPSHEPALHGAMQRPGHAGLA